jgi:hypothetical protein
MSARTWIPGVLLALMIAAPATAAVGAGTSMFAIQLAKGRADLVAPESGTGYVSAYDHSEWGVQGQYWRMMSDDYALTLSGGVGMFSETNEPGDNATPGDEDFEYSQSSWNVRIGGDRVVSVGDRALLYFGPGIEYWSGTAKFDYGSLGSEESEAVTRISLSARIGAMMNIGPSWGLSFQVGSRLGYATVEDAGAKATWWPSSTEGAGGITFVFGGTQ